MEEEKIRHGIGGVVIKEKYKFLPQGLVAEIVRDFLVECEK